MRKIGADCVLSSNTMFRCLDWHGNYFIASNKVKPMRKSIPSTCILSKGLVLQLRKDSAIYVKQPLDPFPRVNVFQLSQWAQSLV